LGRQNETKFIHNKLTCKLGRLKNKHRRLYTQGCSRKDLSIASKSDTPSEKIIKNRNVSVIQSYPLSESTEANNGFCTKLFRERCQNIRQRKRGQFCETEALECAALPQITRKSSPRLTRINMFNKPIEISFTSYLTEP
jgi:hypothetical protein